MKAAARTLLIHVLMAGALLVASSAHADAVPPAPDNCPRGALGQTGHSGQYCAPSTCTSPSTCTEGNSSCAPVGLCITHETFTEGGMRAASDQPPGHFTRDVAAAACNAGETCADGSPCVVVNRCVSATLADAFNPKNAGCGCSLAGHADVASGMALALVGALSVVCLRRATRRPKP